MLDTGFLWVILAMGLYGLLHSLLAGTPAKALAERWFGQAGKRFYRIFYVMVVTVTFIPVLGLILLLPDRRIYTIPFPWLLFTGALQFLALGGLLLAFRNISTTSFLGIRQALDPSETNRQYPLVETGVFRYTRHPLYLFSILILWLVPIMTWNILAFNLAATAYMMIGTIPGGA